MMRKLSKRNRVGLMGRGLVRKCQSMEYGPAKARTRTIRTTLEATRRWEELPHHSEAPTIIEKEEVPSMTGCK